MELILNLPIQWLVCQLHPNELPLRHLFAHVDRTTTGPRSLTSEIRKSLVGCKKLRVVSSTPIENTICEVTNKKDFKVVLREDLVVVVLAFSMTVEGDESIFSGLNILIVRFVAVFLGCSVHQPGDVQAATISRHTSDEERIPHGFAPTPDGDHSWQDQAEENEHRNVEPGK
ncbi:hypothetical protein AVEN_120082-1 [Araneus ventricosus]|uniref:Uncharacterized protein n=1 Tax=Araneus ventricosus TaxID=182803 RepID=A0A4Y2G1P0_ARAVE|nr:hypothetical protein AVEN_120082-1 [Araneus ventricosus]